MIADERAGYLEEVYRHPAQTIQGPEIVSEVVDREPASDLAHRLHEHGGIRGMRRDGGLVGLEHQEARLDPRGGDLFLKQGEQLGVLECRRTEIDEEAGLPTFAVQRGKRLDRLADNPTVDGR